MRALSILAALALAGCGSDAAPVIDSLAIEPASPTTLTELRAQASASDPDGDAVTVAYSWTINGEDASVDADTLPADRFVRGDLVAVTASPVADGVTGEPASASVEIGNSPPVVTSVVITPQGATSADRFTAEAEATDADDDGLSFTFTWTVDGVEVGSGPTLEPPNPEGSVVAVVAVASDGIDDSEPVTSQSVTTANGAPPTPATPTLEAERSWLPSVLLCTTSAVADPEGEAVRYEFAWSRDGVEEHVEQRDDPISTAPESETVRGGVFTCRVRAIDASGHASDWSPMSAGVDQSCDLEEVTIRPLQDASLSYTSGASWNDGTLRAYEYGRDDGNSDIVAWMDFDLGGGGPVAGVRSATLRLFTSTLESNPEVVIVQTAATGWSDDAPTAEVLVRTGQITEPTTSLTAGTWAAFPLDMEAWTDGFGPERTRVTIGVDNLNTLYSYAYFGSLETDLKPELVVEVCR